MVEGTQRRLAAIVSADVVGYSRLMGIDEAGTLATLRAHRQTLIDPAIAQHGGRIVKTMGDGLLLEFPSVVNAVECCVQVQRGMIERNRGVNEDRRITFRIGVNLGDIIIDGDDIHGDGVNVAARLQGMAEPECICVSASVFEQVTGKLDLEFVDLGNQTLKNIERPVRVYSLTAPISNDASEPVPRVPLAGIVDDIDFSGFERPSVIVMPFKDLGGAEQGSLAEGLRLCLHSVLIKMSGLFLVHTTVAEGFRGRDYSHAEVGQEINVRYVIEGAVQRSGDRVRVTIELTDTVRQQLKWGERYDRVLEDIFDLQDEVALEIVKALDIELRAGAYVRHLFPKTTNRLAREKFHRAISHFYKGAPGDSHIARQLLTEFGELEPDVPLCLGLIAVTHWRDAKFGWSDDPVESLHKAEEFAERTIALGDPEGLGYTIMANISLHQQQHERALTAAEEAIERRPSCPLANGLHAEVMQYSGRPDEAIAGMKAAIRLSRSFPPWILNTLASSLRDNKEIEESITVANEAVRLAPDTLDALVTLCSDYSLASMHHDAKRIGRQIVRIDPSFSVKRYADGQPYKDKAMLQRIVDGLSSAGLPA